MSHVATSRGMQAHVSTSFRLEDGRVIPVRSFRICMCSTQLYLNLFECRYQFRPVSRDVLLLQFNIVPEQPKLMKHVLPYLVSEFLNEEHKSLHWLFLSSALFKAFGHAYSTQRKVAEDGENNEKTLLQESAAKEAYYVSRLLELQSELKHYRASTSTAQAEKEHLTTVMQELREVQQLGIGIWKYIIYVSVFVSVYLSISTYLSKSV